MKRLNQIGSLHLSAILGILVALGVGYTGYRVLNESHAQTPTPVIYTTQDLSTSPLTTTVNSILSGGSPVSLTTANTNNSYIKYSAVYSHSRKFVAWQQDTNGAATGNIAIYDTTTKAPTLFSLPTGESSGNVNVPLVWFPDDSAIALVSWNSSTNAYTLWELTLGGITHVVKVTPLSSDPTGVVVTGDGQYIVYTDATGIHKVQLGGAPSLVLSSSCTGNLAAKPGAVETVTYTCENFTSGRKPTATSTVYSLTLGSSPTTLYSSSGSSTNGSFNNINRLAWSPDGSGLAVLYDTITYTNNVNCAGSATTQTKVGTINFTRKGGMTTLTQMPVKNLPLCMGAAPTDNNTLSWGPDGSVGYVYSGGLYTTSSTPTNTNSQLATSNVTDVSW